MDVSYENIGELLYSCLNKVTTTTVETGVYSNKFTKDSTNLLNQSYTYHVARGLNSKEYNLGVVKSLAFKGPVDGKISVDADILFQQEAAEGGTLTPTWTDPLPAMFYQTVVNVGGTDDKATIKEWNLTIDNQAQALWVLNNQQYCSDIVAVQKMQVSGGFVCYFADETKRTAFLAGTATALKITATGTTAILDTHMPSLCFNMPVCQYSAVAYSDQDGMLGAAVTFDAFYDYTSTETIDVTLVNDVSAY